MSNQIYSCNFRLENFTGWDGISTADYSSVTATDTSEQNSLGYIIPGSDSQNNNSNILGCLRSNLVDETGNNTSTDDIWIAWQDATINSGVANTELIQLIINGSTTTTNETTGETTDTPMYLFMTKSNTLNSYDTIINFYLNSDMSFKDPIFSVKINDGNTKVIRLNYIQIIGAGSNSATINFWTQIASDYTTLEQLESKQLDLTTYNKITSYSYHRTMTGTNSNNYLYYTLSSNFRLLKMIFNYQLSSGIGTKYNQWAGDTTTFSTYPVNFESYGTGLYASSNGLKETFKFGNVTSKQGFIPAAVVFSSAVISGTDITDPSVSDIVCNSAQDSNNSVTKNVSKTGSGLTWFYMLDPITNSRWTVSNINTYEIGLNRVS